MMMDDIYFCDPVECSECHRKTELGSIIWLNGSCICPECYEKKRILDHHGGKEK